jgi:hypothetical protein
MHLATLDIDVEQAKAGLDEYTGALRIERTAEDEAIAAAYRAAARGLPIISLSGGEPDDLATVSDELHMVMTMRQAASIPTALDAGRLFDMPIRRDPAARRPLFELIPKAER